MGQLAPAADQHLAAGDLAGVDVRGPEVIVDAGETGGVEARRRRICGDAHHQLAAIAGTSAGPSSSAMLS